MIVENGLAAYAAGKLVADNGVYRIYLCEEMASERQCLLQVATETKHNGALDRSAYLLRELARVSEVVDAAYAASKSNPDKRLGYDKLFPELVDSFISLQQGERRLNVLAFRNVKDVSDMVPLANLASKDRLRVDLRTSAWIMGRLLKLLGLVHNEGIAARNLSGGNILLEPAKHYAVVFDWSTAQLYSGEVPKEERAEDIKQAARVVIAALGGQVVDGYIPDIHDAVRPYTDYLLRLAEGHESNAEKAHHKFYELVDGLWERKYYKFTTMPLSG